MRLLDKILSQEPHSSMAHMMRELQYAFQVIACDPVAYYVRERLLLKEASVDVSKEFPFCQPPWDFTFCEWNMGDSRFNVDGRTIQQAGFLLWCDHFKNVRSNFIGVTPEWLAHYAINDETDVLMGEMVMCAAGRVHFHPGRVLCFLTPEGSAGSVVMSGDGDDIGTLGMFSIVLASFTFANCCNVKLEDVTEELQPVPKIRRRLMLPEIRRYTLNIMGHAAKVSRDWNEGEKGVMPWHLCRGHFATYTPDKPMFGNPKMIGRYWHPPHMRGKKENGVVVKDYAIKEQG